ncbi:hypothetical protein T484DRAFT_1806927, partial [Baffinella frigidus]
FLPKCAAKAFSADLLSLADPSGGAFKRVKTAAIHPASSNIRGAKPRFGGRAKTSAISPRVGQVFGGRVGPKGARDASNSGVKARVGGKGVVGGSLGIQVKERVNDKDVSSHGTLLASGLMEAMLPRGMSSEEATAEPESDTAAGGGGEASESASSDGDSSDSDESDSSDSSESASSEQDAKSSAEMAAKKENPEKTRADTPALSTVASASPLGTPVCDDGASGQGTTALAPSSPAETQGAGGREPARPAGKRVKAIAGPRQVGAFVFALMAAGNAEGGVGFAKRNNVGSSPHLDVPPGASDTVPEERAAK